MIVGNPRFDAIAVGEVTVSFLGTTVNLSAKAAFVQQKTGETHGWTQSSNWSPETMAKLYELRTAMEVDLGRVHFEGGGYSVTARAGTVLPRPEESGLGEHLGDEQ